MALKESNRVQFIDLAKGICIVQIVILHCLQPLGNDLPLLDFLGYLRMPLYFCLSGMFYKDYSGFSAFFRKKFNKILLPFIAWYIIGYSILFFRNIFIANPSPNELHITDIFVADRIFNNPLWFLLSLFWTSILFRAIQIFARNTLTQISLVILLGTTGILMSHLDIKNFLYIGSSLSCLPFFYMGYFLSKYTSLISEDFKKNDLILICGCGFIVVVFTLFPVSIPALQYHLNVFSQGFVGFFYIFSASFVLSVILICKFLKRIPYISFLGRYSIIVLVTHMLIVYFVQGILGRFINLDSISEVLPYINILVIFASMLIIIPFCRRYFPYICAQKELIKPKMSIKQEVSIN